MTQTTLIISDEHLNAAVEAYLHSLRMIPTNHTVIEVERNFSHEVEVVTRKE